MYLLEVCVVSMVCVFSRNKYFEMINFQGRNIIQQVSKLPKVNNTDMVKASTVILIIDVWLPPGPAVIYSLYFVKVRLVLKYSNQ